MTGECIEALYSFFSSFGLPAYPENGVPDRDADGVEVKPPYITVQPIAPDWRSSMPFFAQVWYRGSNIAALNAIVDRIGAAIGEGVSIPTDHGAVYLYKGDRFYQLDHMQGDPALKRAYLNMIIDNGTG